MAIEPKKPWSRIEICFNPPLQDDQIQTEFTTSFEDIAYVRKNIIPELDKIITFKKIKKGLARVHPLSMSPQQRHGLGLLIKEDSRWKEQFKDLTSLLEPGLDVDEVLADPVTLEKPDWNSEQFGLLGYDFSTGKLIIKGQYSHSYFDQISQIRDEKGVQKFLSPKFDPMSVAGVLITSDDYLVLGFRGGHSFADTIMNIPAGSVEPHSTKNPLFESFYGKELPEETGLTREDLGNYDLGLVAITNDSASQDNRSYAVFRIRTNLEIEGLIKSWESCAKDRNEYRRLVFLPYSDEKLLFSTIKANMFNYPNAKDRLSDTVPENRGVWLPQCAVNVLSSLASFNQDYHWEENTQQYFDNHFDLTSWREK